MTRVQNGVKALPEIWTGWVGCTNVTDDRQPELRRQIPEPNIRVKKLLYLLRIYQVFHKKEPLSFDYNSRSHFLVDFYPNVTYVTFRYLPSQIRLSVVCNVRASYSADWNFRQCFYAILGERCKCIACSAIGIRWHCYLSVCVCLSVVVCRFVVVCDASV